MISALTAFRAVLQTLDALGRAKKPTDTLLHRCCEAFVAFVAKLSGERVTLLIGQAVIARGSE